MTTTMNTATLFMPQSLSRGVVDRVCGLERGHAVNLACRALRRVRHGNSHAEIKHRFVPGQTPISAAATDAEHGGVDLKPGAALRWSARHRRRAAHDRRDLGARFQFERTEWPGRNRRKFQRGLA